MNDTDSRDFFPHVENLSAEDYKNALIKIDLSEEQLKMLKIQYDRPDKTITSPELAKAMDYKHFAKINNIYGELGHQIADALEIGADLETYTSDPETPAWFTVLSSYKKVNGKIRWTMRPALADALKTLKWVD